MRVILDFENSGVLGGGLIWRGRCAVTRQRYYAGGESAVRPCPVVLFDQGREMRGILLSVSPLVKAVLLSVATPFHGRI